MAGSAPNTDTSVRVTAPNEPPRDVELAHRDAKLRRLVDANIIGVATCDADGHILEANDAFLDMVDYSRDDLASGRLGWRELTPPEWQAVSMRAWRRFRRPVAAKSSRRSISVRTEAACRY